VPSPAAARSCSEKHFACTVRCMDKDDTIMCVKRTCNHQEQQCLAEEARVPKTREPKGREPGVPKGGGRRG
jgi:hypothetical protein